MMMEQNLKEDMPAVQKAMARLVKNPDSFKEIFEEEPLLRYLFGKDHLLFTTWHREMNYLYNLKGPAAPNLD